MIPYWKFTQVRLGSTVLSVQLLLAAIGILAAHFLLLRRARTKQLSVTIGGQDAEVVYYGAAPQAVAGLLQVNARVPDNIASGDAEVLIQVGSAKSQTGLTVAVR